MKNTLRYTRANGLLGVGALAAAALCGMGCLLAGNRAGAQAADPPKKGNEKKMEQKSLGYQDTPVLPGTKWHVHDGLRPQPPVVSPGAYQDVVVPAPADAVVLFDGKSLEGWRNGKGETAAWTLENGYMQVAPGTGDIYSRKEFGDCQLHVEFCSPSVVKGDGQGRGNSGVFLMERYEFQVLDCYENPTYPDGTVGAVYGQYPPLVNAARKPGEWQTYDIFWTAPRFEGEKVVSPASVTILLNGVLVQNHTVLMGMTQHKVLPFYKEHGPVAPLKLQDHGDLVRFRNIWYRPLSPRAGDE
jgi:hypothetical protein